MATLIPSYSACASRMQAGERRFAQRLEDKLEDDYLCWYDMPVGDRRRYSDFIVLHPRRGLLLLEVKDWRLATIQSMDRISAQILTDAGPRVVSNPLEQVRQCTYQLIGDLERDPQLVQHEGRHRGKLALPWGYGVVLSGMTRKQFEGTDLGDVLPPHRVICADEMREASDAEEFQQRLWHMFDVSFPQSLTLPQIDRIRWHLFPEVRIGHQQADLFAEVGDEASADGVLPDLVKVMDMQQELLARSLGEGHRVIHGVAGSGKTLILGYRCLHLARLLAKPILVLCYNIALAARLRDLIASRGIADKVSVYHFHDWCSEQLRAYHVERPATGKDYFDQLVSTVIGAVDQGLIPCGQYGAVMIDEGHDFAPEWLRLIVGMVDPETSSFLMLYDDAQSIYGKHGGLDFSLSSVGIQARGRSTVLKLNYRNTEDVIRFAYDFARAYLTAADADDDHVPLIEPQSSGRRGPPPVLRILESERDEMALITRTLKKMHAERGVAWADMCVACPDRCIGDRLHRYLKASSIPVHWLSDSQSKRCFSPSEDTVKLMTMHSSKGLEFPFVVVCGTHTLPRAEDDAERVAADAKLLYVAMTRSTERLLVTASAERGFAARLKAMLGSAATA